MRFLLVLTASAILFCSQFEKTDARPYNKPARASSLKPYTEGALLYRTEQLDPALMRRSPPEEVLDKYVKENQARDALFNQLRNGGNVDLFQLTSGSARSRYFNDPRR